ncbi:MAG: ABC1 kinase family protein [Chloroflexota bacterium]
MNSSRLRARYRRIMAFFIRHTISFIFWEIFLARLGLRRLSRRTRARRFTQAAIEFRALAIQLGGVMIKVGQFLSSRLDVLPPEVTDQLAGLQDEVPPEDFTAIRRLAEAELGAPLEEKFAEFDPQPLAAASLGQVHRACLRKDTAQAESFRQVVVKIQRPFIDQLIEVDLSALRRVGGWLQRYKPIRKRVNLPALIQEFSDTIRQEIDYLAEGKNAERFSANFAERPRVHVPRVVWELTTPRILTLEDVYAIKITDYDAITAAGIDRAEVASELLDTYLQQIFQDSFFHADPHPGNLFVTPVPQEEQGWRLTFVDFGMVGQVPDDLRDGLRELLIAVGTRDAGRVIRAYQMLDVLLPGADLQLIEQAEAQLFERFWGMSMRELRQISHSEMMHFARQFRELMYSMPFQLPHNLLLLGRTVAILSGMCTGLDPNFNVWAQLEPYAQKLIAAEASSNWRVWLDEIGEALRLILSLPGKTERALTLMAEGKMAVQTPQLDRRVARLERAINRLYGGLVASTLLGSGTLLLVNGWRTLGIVFLAAGLGVALWSLFFPPFSPPSE